MDACPTAQTLRAETTDTAVRVLLSRKLGLGTRFQAFPFQCRVRVWSVPSLNVPTAQPSFADTNRTLVSLSESLGLGLGTRFQAVPSQCTMSVRGPTPLSAKPTAQTSLEETARTPASSFWMLPGSGPGTTVHDVPSQCSIRALSARRLESLLGSSESKPTAQASHADSTATPWNSLSVSARADRLHSRPWQAGSRGRCSGGRHAGQHRRQRGRHGGEPASRHAPGHRPSDRPPLSGLSCHLSYSPFGIPVVTWHAQVPATAAGRICSSVEQRDQVLGQARVYSARLKSFAAGRRPGVGSRY